MDFLANLNLRISGLAALQDKVDIHVHVFKRTVQTIHLNTSLYQLVCYVAIKTIYRNSKSLLIKNPMKGCVQDRFFIVHIAFFSKNNIPLLLYSSTFLKFNSITPYMNQPNAT